MLSGTVHGDLGKGYLAEVGNELGTKEWTRIGMGSRKGISEKNRTIDTRCHVYEYLPSVFLNPFAHPSIFIEHLLTMCPALVIQRFFYSVVSLFVAFIVLWREQN